MPRFVFGVLLSLSLALSLPAADWPQFLGPNRDNTTTEKVPVWKGDLKPVWKQPVGDSHSSPVVANGVVYAFYQPKGANTDALAAFEAKTGKRLWVTEYDRDPFSPPFGEGPRGTPAIADGKIYTLGGTGVLACWDLKTGDVAWKVDTLKEFKAANLTFGVSGSPLVHAGKVYVNVGGKGHGVVAFDAKTGKTVWQSTDDTASYSSPIIADLGGKKQVVFLTGAGLVGLDPETGKELWREPFKDKLQESATAPLVADGLLIGSSVTLGSVALKIGEKDGQLAAIAAWKNPKLNCYFSTPALVGKDQLYMINGVLSITPSITLRCVDPASGKVKWEKPNIGKYHAALVRTGDNKLLMLDDGGTLTLIDPDPAAYKELARAKVCGPTWAHPAVADGMVFLRDEKDLLAFKIGE